MMRRALLLPCVLLLFNLGGPDQASADPCGMVPPAWDGPGPAITRVGVQQTYVFYKEGIESFVIRPGFSGKVDTFGMLIPFPTPPAIRKVDDAIFSHVAAAAEPPPVVVNVRGFWRRRMVKRKKNGKSAGAPGLRFKEQVKVLKQEAVGMYEVAVLAAGSAKALKKWMGVHGYRYPKGMDAVTEDYVDLGWCFVAVKTRVGQKKGVTPRPGMKGAKSKLPAGATFDGNVQAMGFRFRTPKLVVPMRLSAFNAGELHNTVYVLTDRPMKINDIPSRLVVKQIPGPQLVRHLTELRPIKLVGGTAKDMERMFGKDWERRYRAQRAPATVNGFARDLFASDLEAVRLDVLALPHEEREKVLLRIGERLDLRGEEIDKLHRQILRKHSKSALNSTLTALAHMTLTVVDGDFPRKVLAEQNLTFSEYVKDGLDEQAFPKPRPLKGTKRPSSPPKKPAPPKKKGGGEKWYGALPSEKAYALGFTCLLLFVLAGFGLRRRLA